MNALKNTSIIILSLIFISINGYSQTDSNQIYQKYKNIVKKIYKKANADSSAWEELAYICDTFGPRLSGSAGLEKAIDYIVKTMKKEGLDNVRKEPVMVPKWVRGNEYCELLTPRRTKIYMLGLGRSIGTPAEGITSEVIVVKNFKELEKRKNEVKGKIVLFNEPFKSYGQSVQYRWKGAIEAAKYGAIASMCRSASPLGMRLPHTGVMAEYPDTVKKIPHFAISAEDAHMLQRMQDRGQKIIVKVYMEAKTYPDSKSYNVIGELRGTQKPDEIVAMGGHIDSWDVGSGAQDDGSGIIATWKALKLLKDLNLRAKRTIREVMWVNEENGTRGGIAYARKHKDENHILMFEFDSGVFPKVDIGIKGNDSVYTKAKSIEKVLQILGKIPVHKGAWGVDAGKIAKLKNIPLMSMNTDDQGKYFWFHHSPADMPDAVDPQAMNDCVAAIAAMIYIYADLP